jgi:branched-chain amino acid transport system substrate-binding protein
MQAFMKKRNETKVSFIYRNDDYGKTGMAHFDDAGKPLGFEIVSNDAIAATASDATTQLTHVKAAAPQALICWTTLPSANVILKAYRELGAAAADLLFRRRGDRRLPKTGRRRARRRLHRDDEGEHLHRAAEQRSAAQAARALRARLREGYPKDAPASIFGTWGYDGVNFLKAALAKVKGPVTAASLRDAMENTTFVGVSGTFRSRRRSTSALAEDAVLMAQIENQHFRIAK